MRDFLIELVGNLCLCIDDAEYVLELRYIKCASASNTFAQHTQKYSIHSTVLNGMTRTALEILSVFIPTEQSMRLGRLPWAPVSLFEIAEAPIFSRAQSLP
jgi:hypothetical protein